MLTGVGDVLKDPCRLGGATLGRHESRMESITKARTTYMVRVLIITLDNSASGRHESPINWQGVISSTELFSYHHEQGVCLTMPLTPLILSAALPSELLTYIIRQHEYPTTLIICSSQAAFLTSLIADVQQSLAEVPEDSQALSSLLYSPLYQVAIARHIRMIFVPTVSHLRACLSVFDTRDSKVPPPPPTTTSGQARTRPLLLVYGFLALHRDTSEWSAQGISSTATCVVEAARRVGFRAVVVDPPRALVQDEDGSVGQDAGDHDGIVGSRTDQTLMSEEVTVLSARARKAGADPDEADWTGRTVTLMRTLGRWFRYRQGDWAYGMQENT